LAESELSYLFYHIFSVYQYLLKTAHVMFYPFSLSVNGIRDYE